MPKRHLGLAGERSQLQMGESIMVFVMIVIVGAVALTFFTRSAMDDISVNARQRDRFDAIETAQAVSSLPELRCEGVSVTRICIDKGKAEAMAALWAVDERSALRFTYYRDLFGDSRITITSVYPATDEDPLVIHAAAGGTYSSAIPTRIPIALYDPVTMTTGFGIIEVLRYSAGEASPAVTSP